jgi:hypothetical protein
MTEMNMTLSDMKAQISKTKKRNLTVSKAGKEKVKEAQKEAKKKAVKVTSTEKPKAAKKTSEKKPKVSYDVREAEVAKMMKLELAEKEIKGKLRKIASKDAVTLVSMPERKELVIKVKGVAVCEIYPRGEEFKICTREKFVSQVKLPEDVKVEHHELWDMTEMFMLKKENAANVFAQFAKITTK